jgi:glycosyltransferase involved in cell wall biosynthesis
LDVAVHPSHSENLGGAAESLAAGIPTISTNVGGFPDIVINNQTGYTVNPKSPKELADAIIKTINSHIESRRMAFAGHELVREMLDIKSTSENILEIYNNILSYGNVGEKNV